MTASRTDLFCPGFRPCGLWALLLAGFLAAAGPAGPAGAQETAAPLELLPLTPPAPEEEETEAQTGEDGGAGGGVQVENLKAANPDGAGLLKAAEGGFGETLWRTSDRVAAGALLDRIGPPKGLAAARLTRRLLLSAAPPPPGPGEPGAFLERRLSALARTGRMDDAAALAGGVPDAFKTPVSRRIEAEALLLAGQDARACAIAAAEAADDPASSYWALTFAYCQVLGGQENEAELAVSLLRETGDTTPAFEGLFAALRARRPVTAASLDNAGPLELAMMRTISAGLPDGAALPENPALYPALARMESMPADLRARALEAALAIDLITPEAALAAADSLPFDDSAVAGALTFAKKDSGALGRSLMLRAVRAQSASVKRAQLASQAMQLAARDGAVTGAARLFMPVVRELPGDDPELVRFAEYGLRAGLAAQEYGGAARWLALMDAGGVFLPDVKAAHDLLLPFARISGAEGVRWTGASFPAWAAAARAAAGAGTRTSTAGAGWIAAAMSALGQPLARSAWAEALAPAPESADAEAEPAAADTPRKGPWGLPGAAGAALLTASAEGRTGETAAAALVVLSETGADLDAGATYAFVTALKNAGMEAEARALLMDIAAAKGF